MGDFNEHGETDGVEMEGVQDEGVQNEEEAGWFQQPQEDSGSEREFYESE